ncbi:hypothetical protein WHR41_08550 [Cladosporium halotolerans]|uniref:Conserved oligomeric Golgi complex subunit 1 n=1 Tax=Cladosporium halotolerans TaxID=1052096 RepID=A0AB34KH07_9PEZI
MATIPPTPSSLGSWEEAFNHPLPVVRKLESQLRTQISDNQNKLRSLVGASYRDLLGTAERIIEMDGQMSLVEGNLSDIGRRCDYRIVERGRGNLDGLRKAGRKEEESKLEVTAQVKMLTGALDAVARLVRKRGNALGAAKVLVLARLLHKSVSESDNAPTVIAELRKKLARTRKRLLSYIERSLAHATGDRTTLSNTLCAYAMISSSTPKDALRHFLQVRYEQLESKAETTSEENVLTMLDLYGKTLVDARDLFPRRLADALAQLSKTALLKDDQVTSVQELNLDIYQRWIPEDIRTFTPWVRSDQLTISDLNDGLKFWAKQAQSSFVQALESYLESQADAEVVLSTRRNVLSRFLSVSSKLKNDDFTQSITNLRNAFLNRLETLATQSADISSFALQSLTDPPSSLPTTQPSPWTLATQTLDLSAGALPFRTAILDHRRGRTGPIKTEHTALDRWTTQLNSHWAFVASMRSAKWDDDLAFDLDDLPYDGPDSESLQEALSRADPARLEQTLRAAASAAFASAYRKVSDAAAAQPETPAFFLRLLRELDARRAALADRLASSSSSSSPNEALITTLHTSLATQTLSAPCAAYAAAAQRQSHTATSLWDGAAPPLPCQPSPAAWKLLAELQGGMAACGEDLWSARAVAVLKGLVREELREAVGRFPEGGDGEVRAQRVFDVLYFGAAFGAETATTGWEERVGELVEGAGVDAEGRARMERGAGEYWKRTGVLFGLLGG